MNYQAAIADFFKSPKWVTNLLLAGVCMLIPVVGPIVVMGWLVTGFWGRHDDRFETFPDFDFGAFAKYLERGMWPFLVTLVASLAIGLVAGLVIMLPIAILGGLLAGGDGAISAIFGLFIGILSMAAYAAIFCVISLVVVPLAVRSSILQDFVPSFDITFVKSFAKLMWKEIVMASLFMAVAGTVIGMVGLLALCVGVYAAIVLVYFGWTHLSWQIYQIYLFRGGLPVPVSPKLSEVTGSRLG